VALNPTGTDNESFERATTDGDFTLALRLAEQMLAGSKRNVAAWTSRIRAKIGLGETCEADEDIDVALRLDGNNAHLNWLRALIDQRLGRVDRAIDGARKLACDDSPIGIEAKYLLVDALYLANRREEVAKLIHAGGVWLNQPRGRLHLARAQERENSAKAVEEFIALFRSTAADANIRRIAGFDAVKWLDKLGRYREAYDLAAEVHAATTPPFDVDGMTQIAQQQGELIAKSGKWFTAAADPVQGLAMIVGLPRSGTSLLEQMFDGHSQISGIGEYEGMSLMGFSIESTGVPVRNIGRLPHNVVMQLQQRYMKGVEQLRRPGATWALDKNLSGWRFVYAIAAVLPGTVCFQVARDPRDMAISTFLSMFHPIANGWTSKLDAIRDVITTERAVTQRALETLDIAHESMVYENFVLDPEAHVKRCLDRLGLTLENSVLQPQDNKRQVFTLSFEQVKKPINTSSIGRWRNYEWAFDRSWDTLVAAHDARRV